jgi:hypothetical protein
MYKKKLFFITFLRQFACPSKVPCRLRNSSAKKTRLPAKWSNYIPKRILKKLAAKNGTTAPFQLLLRYFEKQGQPAGDSLGDKWGLFINIGLQKKFQLHFKKEEKGKGLTTQKDDTATGDISVQTRDGQEVLVFQVSKSSKMKPVGWKEALKALKKYLPAYEFVLELPGQAPQETPTTPEEEPPVEANPTSNQTTDETVEETSASMDEVANESVDNAPIKPLLKRLQTLFKTVLPQEVIPAIKERELTPEHAQTLAKALEETKQLLAAAKGTVTEKLQPLLQGVEKKQQPQLKRLQQQVDKQLQQYQEVEVAFEAAQKDLTQSEGTYETLMQAAPPEATATAEETTTTTEPTEQEEATAVETGADFIHQL